MAINIRSGRRPWRFAVPLTASLVLLAGCLCPGPADLAHATLRLEASAVEPFRANATNEVHIEITNQGPEAVTFGPVADGRLDAARMTIQVTGPDRTFSNLQGSTGHVDTGCGARWAGCDDLLELPVGASTNTTLLIVPNEFSPRPLEWVADQPHDVVVELAGKCQDATWRGTLNATIVVMPVEG